MHGKRWMQNRSPQVSRAGLTGSLAACVVSRPSRHAAGLVSLSALVSRDRSREHAALRTAGSLLACEKAPPVHRRGHLLRGGPP